jgi:hypothetical protein
MKEYKVEILFNDVDENLYTKGRAKIAFDVEADDYSTAYHLGQRLQRTLGADELVVIEPIERVSITAEMVRNLRNASDCPMMECKNALYATNGDMNKAMEWLRTPSMLRKWSVNKDGYERTN